MEEEDIGKFTFTFLDYSLFFGMLALSALVGAYFGFFGKKQNTPEEYLHGGKNMKIFPIAASLVATDISGITLLASPADVYINGSAYSMVVFATIIMSVVLVYVFLPVFYELQVTSSFEYLQLRFNDKICKMASFIFALIGILFLPVLIYIPALALNQVSGLQLNIIIPAVCLVCIFYTTIGGIKAVVWTDTLQMLFMIGSLLCVFFLGLKVEGGFGNVWSKAQDGGRVDFNFDPDPTSKRACLTVFIGFTTLLCGSGANAITVQRFVALPTFTDVKITAVIFCIGSVFFKAFSWFLGLIIYAHYNECSPLAAGYIAKPDQILPYYIMDVSSSLPGLPGIFIAGLFCAALSSISSGLNTMAGTIYEDFIKQHMPETTTGKRASDIMKLIVVVLGILFIILVFAVEYLGALLQLTVILGGIVVGPLLALFTLGMLVPHVNSKGVLFGTIAGLLAVLWIVVGAVYYKINGQIQDNYLEFSTEGCPNFNSTISSSPLLETEPPMFLYRLSYYYYSVVGFLATTIVAIPISLVTGGAKQTVDKNLISPIIRPFLSTRDYTSTDVDRSKELDTLGNRGQAPRTLNDVYIEQHKT